MQCIKYVYCGSWYNSGMILRQSRCKDCGFLCFMVGEHYTKAIEYSPKERAEGIERLSPYSLPHCYRHNYTFEIELNKTENDIPDLQDEAGQPIYSKEKLTALLELTLKKRRCNLYMKYAPGYSPELHLSRFETFERERSARRWNLIWLLVGVVLTLLAGIVTRLVFPTSQ